MHDPRSTDNIYLILEKGKHIEPCTLLDKERRFRGWDWFDVEEYFAVRSQKRQKNKSYELQKSVEHLARKDAITEEEVRKTEEARIEGVSNAQRLGHIESNKHEELRQEHQKHSWKPTTTSAPPKKNRQTGRAESTEQFDILKSAMAELYCRE